MGRGQENFPPFQDCLEQAQNGGNAHLGELFPYPVYILLDDRGVGTWGRDLAPPCLHRGTNPQCKQESRNKLRKTLCSQSRSGERLPHVFPPPPTLQTQRMCVPNRREQFSNWEGKGFTHEKATSQHRETKLIETGHQHYHTPEQIGIQ